MEQEVNRVGMERKKRFGKIETPMKIPDDHRGYIQSLHLYLYSILHSEVLCKINFQVTIGRP